MPRRPLTSACQTCVPGSVTRQNLPEAVFGQVRGRKLGLGRGRDIGQSRKDGSRASSCAAPPA